MVMGLAFLWSQELPSTLSPATTETEILAQPGENDSFPLPRILRVLDSNTNLAVAALPVISPTFAETLYTDSLGRLFLPPQVPDSLELWSADDEILLLDSIVFAQDSILRVITWQTTSSGATERLDSSGLVVISRGKSLHLRKEASRHRLQRRDLQRVVATQNDPLKAIGMLPGVSNQSDMSVRPFVRGGKSEETRVFLNGIPLLQPYHIGSVYSIFNSESLEDLDFYSGSFPVEGGNALSGALFLRTRRVPMDSTSLALDLSLLRGNAYFATPIIENKLGVYASFHSFWYDQVINRGWDVLAWAADDSGFTAQKQAFQRYIELPNFKDFQFGTDWNPHPSLTLGYTGLLSRDVFTTMQNRRRYYLHGREISPGHYERTFFSPELTNGRVKRDMPDTIALTNVDNDAHIMGFTWRQENGLRLEGYLARQNQNWNVLFLDEEIWLHDTVDIAGVYQGRRTYGSGSYRFGLDREVYNSQIKLGYSGLDGHLFTFGAAYDRWSQKFDTHLPRPIYEILVNSNVDLLNSLGYGEPDGFVITQSDSFLNTTGSFLSDLPYRIRFDHKGTSTLHYLSLFASDVWDLSPNRRLTYGVRGEWESGSEEIFPSPRVALFQKLGASDEITLASGLYSQNDLPFQMRNQNPRLKSEKAWHGNIEWTHRFSGNYRFEWQNYYKVYYDLVSPSLELTGKVDWLASGIPGMDSARFDTLNTVAKMELLRWYGDKEFRYRNIGKGRAVGMEFSLFYDPAVTWGGWMSMEMANSLRQDQPGQRWYSYRYHRNWTLNWVNYFKMPSQYELSLRYKLSAGQPYTPYGGSIAGFYNAADRFSDTLVYVAPRNSGRYAATNRFDIRVTKNSTLFGYPFQSYAEIWNAYNSPNMFLRDAQSGRFRFLELNYPIPILFLGLSFRM